MHINEVIEIIKSLMEVVISIDQVEFSNDDSSDLTTSNNIAHVENKNILVGLNSMMKEASLKDINTFSWSPTNNEKALVHYIFMDFVIPHRSSTSLESLISEAFILSHDNFMFHEL